MTSHLVQTVKYEDVTSNVPKVVPILGITKNGILMVPTVHHVVHGSRKFDSRVSQYGRHSRLQAKANQLLIFGTYALMGDPSDCKENRKDQKFVSVRPTSSGFLWTGIGGRIPQKSGTFEPIALQTPLYQHVSPFYF